MKKINRESGVTLILVALSMTVLIGFMAFATDVGVLLHQRREVQTAADSAAIAGATEALAEGNPTSLTGSEWAAAANDAALNGYTAGSSSGTLNSTSGTTLTINVAPNITIPAFNTAGYIQATITQTAPTFFMRAFMGLFGNTGYSVSTVGATAIATDTIASNGCGYVMDPGGAADPAVDMGGSSTILATKCLVTIDGNLDMTGASSLQAGYTAVSGTIEGSDPSGSYAQNVPAQPNPLAYLSTNDYQPTLKTTNGVTTCTAPSGSGLACAYDYQGGALSGQLPSNTLFYFDEASGPSITGTVTGSGDVLYLSGTSMPFDFANNGAVTLTPPSSGSLANVLLDAPYIGGTTTCSHGKGNNVGNPGEIYVDFGSSSTTLNGIFYAPNAQLFGQDQGASTSIALEFVVGNMCMQSATFNIGAISGVNPIKKVALVY